MNRNPDSFDRTATTKGQKRARKLAERFFHIDSNLNTTIRQKLRVVIEKLFWLAIYLAGFVLTILTFIDLYHQYRKNPVSFSITTVNNQTMTLPNPTICLPFFTEEKVVDYYLFGTNFPSKDSSLYSIEDELNSFFDNNTSWEQMQAANWTAPTFYFAMNYLSMIYEIETMQNGKNPLNQLIDDGNNISLAIMDVFLPQMKKWKVSLGQFRDTFSLKAKEIYPITVHDSTGKNFNISQELVFVNKHQVCFKLKLDIFQMTTEYNSISLSFNNKKLQYNKNHHGFLTVGKQPVTVDISGKSRASSNIRLIDSTYIISLEYHMVLKVSPLTQYIYVPTQLGIPKCSVSETTEVCQAICRNEIIKNNCNCTASTVPWRQPLPDTGCLIGQYEDCLNNLSGTEDLNCMEQCLDYCTQWQYDIHVNPFTKKYDELAGIVSSNLIDFTISTYNYQIFREFSQWTSEAIIGDIGGALGFFLGLDFLIIVFTIFTVPVFFFLERLKKKQGTIEMTAEYLRESELRENKLFGQSWNIRDPDFAKWAVGKIIWHLLFLAGAALTIKMFVQLCQQYYGSETGSTFTLTLNQTIMLPESAVCVTMGTFTEYKPVFDGFIQSEFDQYMNETEMSKELLLGFGENDSWPQTLIYMAYIYLRAMLSIQNEPRDIFDGSYNISVDFDILTLTRNAMLKYSVSNEELEKKFGFEFMKYKNISAVCNSASQNKSFSLNPVFGTVERSPPELTSYIIQLILSFETKPTPISVCLHFPLHNFEFNSITDSCLISVYDLDDSFLSTSARYFLAFKSANSYAYENDILFDQINETSGRRMSVTVQVGYSTIYQSIKSCNPFFVSPLDCFKNCREEFTAKVCTNCTITANVTVQENSNSILKCSWKEYSECLINAVPTMKQLCNDACKLPPCTIAKYSNLYISADILDSEFYGIKIHVDHFDFTLITENWLYSQEDFLATCGGLLGFWLGLDCTFLVAIVFTPLMFLIGLCLEKKTTGDEGQVQLTSQFFSIMSFAKLLRVDIANKHRFIIIKALFERLFWIAVYLLFGVLTLIMTVNFCQQYSGAQISVNYGTMRNKTFTIPSITICVPSWFHGLLNYVDRDTNYYFDQRQAEKDLDYIRYLPTKNLETIIFHSSSESKWSDSLLRLSFQFLALVDGYKTMEQGNLSNMWNQLQQINLTNTTMAVDLFGTKLDLLNINSYDLMQKFGEQHRIMGPINATIHVERNGYLGRAVPIDHTTYVSLTIVCYSLPLETFSFDSVYDYIALKTSLSADQCIVASIYPPMMVDLLGRDIPTLVQDIFILERYFTSHSTTAITMGEVYNKLTEVNGTLQCSTTKARDKCASECRISAIEEQCHCTPSRIDVATNTTSINACSWSQYKNCMLYNFFVANASDCIANCQPSCQYIRYEFNYVQSDPFPNINRHSYIAKHCAAEHFFGVSSFHYPMYSEQLDGISFYNFVAGLGGTLGMLLPIDIVMLIESCFSIINWLRNFVAWLKSPNSKENRETPQGKPSRIGKSRKVVEVQPIEQIASA